MTAEQISKLESLGVNLDETLERFVDNEALYFKCLNKMLDDVNYKNMNAAIENQNVSEAFDSAHALKGVSANLGLNKLFKEVQIITEVFRAKSLDYDKANKERLDEAYEIAMATIKEL